MRDVDPQEMIEYFRTYASNEKSKYTRREISRVLQKLGEEHDSTTFKILVDTWADYVVRSRVDELPEGRARIGALENIACLAVVADLGLRTPITKDELPDRMYADKTTYGSAMNEFSQYLGVVGKELVMHLWPGLYQKYTDPGLGQSFN